MGARAHAPLYVTQICSAFDRSVTNGLLHRLHGTFSPAPVRQQPPSGKPIANEPLKRAVLSTRREYHFRRVDRTWLSGLTERLFPPFSRLLSSLACTPICTDSPLGGRGGSMCNWRVNVNRGWEYSLFRRQIDVSFFSEIPNFRKAKMIGEAIDRIKYICY